MMEKKPISTRSERRREAKALKKKQKKLKKNSLRMLGKPVKLINTPQHKAKMSDILDSYAEPLIEDNATYDQMNTALGMAVLFWNVALLMEGKEYTDTPLKRLIDEMLKDGQKNPFAEDNLMQLFQMMAERKQLLFPDESRFILNYELTEQGEDYHLNVASTLSPKDL